MKCFHLEPRFQENKVSTCLAISRSIAHARYIFKYIFLESRESYGKILFYIFDLFLHPV